MGAVHAAIDSHRHTAGNNTIARDADAEAVLVSGHRRSGKRRITTYCQVARTVGAGNSILIQSICRQPYNRDGVIRGVRSAADAGPISRGDPVLHLGARCFISGPSNGRGCRCNVGDSNNAYNRRYRITAGWSWCANRLPVTAGSENQCGEHQHKPIWVNSGHYLLESR